MSAEIGIRPMAEGDLGEADRIFRLAFGTFLRMPDPMRFGGDASFVATRWRGGLGGGFVAVSGGRIVGSVLAANWGSVGFFGPVTVHPELWDKGVARALLAPVMGLFDRWGLRHAGLFTFPDSPKHAALYRSFGFWPRFLAALATRAVPAGLQPPAEECQLSLQSPEGRERGLADCRALAERIHPGLDLSREIRSLLEQRLGEVVVLREGARLRAFAVAHVGAGTEAGSGTCYVKFAAADGPDAFAALLEAIARCASSAGAATVLAGVNYGNEEAARALFAAGYRVQLSGITMVRPNEPAYHRAGVYALGDWR